MIGNEDKAPGADKIMDICKVLVQIHMIFLLDESNQTDYIIVDSKTELGQLILDYNSLSPKRKDRLKGYIDGLKE